MSKKENIFVKNIQGLSDDELIIKIVKTNNTVCFGELYDRYADKVYNKCFGFVLNEAEAKDLTQDIFLHLFINLKKFNFKSKFSTWLYSLTYNFCVNYLNRDKEKKISNQSKDIDEEYKLSVEINDHSLLQMKVDRLEKALLKIPPEDKMILQLKYQDDVSIKELVELLQVSESAIKMRLSRAKTKVVEEYNKIEL